MARGVLKKPTLRLNPILQTIVRDANEIGHFRMANGSCLTPQVLLNALGYRNIGHWYYHWAVNEESPCDPGKAQKWCDDAEEYAHQCSPGETYHPHDAWDLYLRHIGPDTG